MAERITFFYRLASQCYFGTIFIGLYFTTYFSINFIRYCIAVDLIGTFDNYIICRHHKVIFVIPTTKCITFLLWLFSQYYCTSILIGFCTAILASIHLICYCVAVNLKASFDYNIIRRHIKFTAAIPVAKCITLFCWFGSQLN